MGIDTLIENEAWRLIQKNDKSVTAKKYRLDLNWDHVKATHHTQYPESGESPREPDCDVTFSSIFANETTVEQKYNFRAENAIRMTTEANLDWGFSIESRFQLRLDTPPLNASAQMANKLFFNRKESAREEKSVSLSIDNPVSVPARRKVTAKVHITQSSYKGKFIIKSTLSGFVSAKFVNMQTGEADHEIPSMYIKSLFDQEKLKAMTPENNEGFNKLKPFVDGDSLVLESSGTCRFNYAKQHEVTLKEDPLERQDKATQLGGNLDPTDCSTSP